MGFPAGSDELHRPSVPSPAPPTHLPYRWLSPTQKRPGGHGHGRCLLRQLQQHVPPAEPAGRTETRRLRPRRLRIISEPVPVAQRAGRQLIRVLPARKQPGVVHPAFIRLAAAVHNELTWLWWARPGLAVHRQPGRAAEAGPAALLLLRAHSHGHPECAREEADPEPDLSVRRRQLPLL